MKKKFEENTCHIPIRHSSVLISASDLLLTSISIIYAGYVEHRPLADIL